MKNKTRKLYEAWNNERDTQILKALEQYFDDSNTADSYQSYSVATPEGVLEVIRPFLATEPNTSTECRNQQGDL